LPIEQCGSPLIILHLRAKYTALFI
jgi:hypothetical protein